MKDIVERGSRDFDDFFGREQEDMSGQLPKEYTDIYNVLSLMSETKLHRSYLLEDKTQHFKVVLKVGEGTSAALLKTEAEVGEKVFSALSETDGRVISYKETDGKGYLLRQYIGGMNLTEYVERRIILTPNEIYDILHILCNKLSILHELNPPMIHRDIKPENIIIRAVRGRIIDVFIIDYGAARNYEEGKTHDTVFVATRQTAAPEQYGFSQTDARTDVYGLGKVLGYILTGDFSRDELRRADREMAQHMKLPLLEYKMLCKVAIRATSLDPGKRFVSVRQMEKAIKKGRNIKKIGAWVAAVLLIAGVTIVTFFAGTRWQIQKNDYVHMDEINDKKSIEVAVNEQGEISFNSKLLEEAVLINFPEGTVLTEEALSQVKSIRIIGNKCYDASRDIWVAENPCVEGEILDNIEQGDVTDLSLIAKMDHLDDLYLGYQGITDISALEGCPVRTLYLHDNGITDFSVLATMPNLEKLYIGRNPVTDLSVLTECDKLYSLNLDDLTVTDIEPLRNLPVGEMEMHGISVLNNDYTPLKDMKSLYSFSTSKTESGLIDVIGELTQLTRLGIVEWSERDLTAISGLYNLSMFSSSSVRLESLAGIEGMRNLQQIYIGGCMNISDVHGLEQLEHLEYIWCNSNKIDDITPLCNLSPTVQTLAVSTDVSKRILEEKPELSEIVKIED